MTSTMRVIVLFVSLGSLPAVAFAGAGTSGAPPFGRFAARSASPRLVPRLHLADVVVNTPQQPPAPVPMAVAEPVVVPMAPVAAAPVMAPRREVVHHHDDNYMSTIAINAFMGALAGALVGGALYYLEDNQTHARRIVYWAAGGVFVGAGVGVVQIMVESRTETVAQSRLPGDPAPTYRLALLRGQF